MSENEDHIENNPQPELDQESLENAEWVRQAIVDGSVALWRTHKKKQTPDDYKKFIKQAILTKWQAERATNPHFIWCQEFEEKAKPYRGMTMEQHTEANLAATKEGNQELLIILMRIIEPYPGDDYTASKSANLINSVLDEIITGYYTNGTQEADGTIGFSKWDKRLAAWTGYMVRGGYMTGWINVKHKEEELFLIQSEWFNERLSNHPTTP